MLRTQTYSHTYMQRREMKGTSTHKSDIQTHRVIKNTAEEVRIVRGIIIHRTQRQTDT